MLQVFFHVLNQRGFFGDGRNPHAGGKELPKHARARIEGVDMALDLLPVGDVLQLDVAPLAGQKLKKRTAHTRAPIPPPTPFDGSRRGPNRRICRQQ